ncbi:site-specific integrase [Lachnospiraceae bacterium]|jgi:integrase|nr:site-specific integrase [Lachnospiraceae bacterium]
MDRKVKRKTTNYKSIYYNETTKKYDVKYNFKEYNVKTGKNKYRSKWIYNLNTITEAKAELAKLQTGGVKTGDKDITLEGAYDLWLIKAQGQNFSPVSIRNTHQQIRMVYQFVPATTKLKDIDEDVYYKFCSDIRKHGYSEETIHSINATFRKMINLAYKKKLIKENILNYADNIKTKKKEDYKTISKEAFIKIDKYFKENEFWRMGINNYPKYRLLFNILYYTGLRIGECIALTYIDFEEFMYEHKKDETIIKSNPINEDSDKKPFQGTRIKIDKSYVSGLKLTKEPKNYKKRSIPLSPAPESLFLLIKEEHLQKGGKLEDKIFNWEYGLCDTILKKACSALDFPKYTCHDFRHTFISNLIRKGVPLPVIEKASGDTQQTILKRYSHMFEGDEMMILTALKDL